MIQNLNPISFKNFGVILNSIDRESGSAQRSSLAIHNAQIPVRQALEGVCLFPEPGLCVLSVSRDDREFSQFYLDKPVALENGVYFYVTPFGGQYNLRSAGRYDMVRVLTHTPDYRVNPRLGMPTIYTFFYQEREQGFVFPGESHKMLELTYVDKGTLHTVADGKDLLLEPGDMVLYGPDQWHMHYADIGVAPAYVTISFELDSPALANLFNRRFPSTHGAIDLLRQMLREQANPDGYSEDVILGLLRQLLLHLLRHANTPSAPMRKPQGVNNENEIIRKAQQFISSQVRQKLTVPLVAKRTDVSPSYLTALFHKHLQISPGEYIRRIKLQESKQLIREGALNFSEIASLLSYSTVHHFSRQFKEKFGITPSEYAKSVK